MDGQKLRLCCLPRHRAAEFSTARQSFSSFLTL
jgi:hypothetical protein